jgi:hypothetical protein
MNGAGCPFIASSMTRTLHKLKLQLELLVMQDFIA